MMDLPALRKLAQAATGLPSFPISPAELVALPDRLEAAERICAEVEDSWCDDDDPLKAYIAAWRRTRE